MNEVMPIQGGGNHGLGQGQVSKPVYMAAYEVYRSVFSEQQALITGNCRGGFGKAELVAFLYARSFPKAEWRERVDEALTGARI